MQHKNTSSKMQAHLDLFDQTPRWAPVPSRATRWWRLSGTLHVRCSMPTMVAGCDLAALRMLTGDDRLSTVRDGEWMGDVGHRIPLRRGWSGATRFFRSRQRVLRHRVAVAAPDVASVSGQNSPTLETDEVATVRLLFRDDTVTIPAACAWIPHGHLVPDLQNRKVSGMSVVGFFHAFVARSCMCFGLLSLTLPW